MRKELWLLVVLTCTSAAVCSGATDPFVGKWKLDISRTTVGDQMAIQAAGENRYTLAFTGSAETETVPADGTEHPGVFGTTISVTIEKPNTWKVVRKKDAKMLLSAIWNLSADGKTLRDAFTAYKPDGSTSTTNTDYSRAAGTTGIPGTWVATVKVDTAYELEIRPFDGDGLTFMVATYPSPRNVTFDGREQRNQMGAGVTVTSVGRRIDQLGREFSNTVDGKILETRQLRLSQDLKKLTIVVHLAGQTLPNTLVFDRE